MKCVILAGGKGTRISELSKSMPKPMIKILGKPIIFRIIMHYYKFGFKDFIIAAGYKKNFIKDYFKKKKFKDIKINVVDTGLNTMTGGRIKRLKKYLNNETFMLTYGDGVADVDINALSKYHDERGKTVTVTAVHPVARFGELEVDGEYVKSFKEKPQVSNGWINGGFFVCEHDFFDYIRDDSTILEREPLENVAINNQLIAYKHRGFWQCMDTKRDMDYLNELYKTNKSPWTKIKNN